MKIQISFNGKSYNSFLSDNFYEVFDNSVNNDEIGIRVTQTTVVTGENKRERKEQLIWIRKSDLPALVLCLQKILF